MAGDAKFGIDTKTVDKMAQEIKSLVEQNVEVAIVVGGGNIMRGAGAAATGMDRSQADYMGMMATIMNGLALQDALENNNQPARVQSSLRVDQVCEPYIRRRAIRHMEKGRVVILSGGTGMPYFTTDTNTMIKAAELKCEMVLMAKNGVDGVYDKDPNVYQDAVKYDTLTYNTILQNQIRVMDLTASSMAEENNLTSVVFNMDEEGSLVKATQKMIGTIITR